MKRILILVLSALALGLVGCGGAADVTIINNTSRYVNGKIDGGSFGVVSGSTTKRRVEISGFFSSSKTVDVDSYAHASYDASSPVVASRHDSMKIESSHSYTYELWFDRSTNELTLKPVTISSKNSLMGP